jgi:hypothetical protein
MKERFNRFYKEENNIYSTVDLTIEKWLKGENINDYEGDRG